MENIILLALLSFQLISADLIAYKYHLNDNAVASKDLPVIVKIFNVGDSTAYEVTLNDFWPEDSFRLVSGAGDIKFDKIPSGGNVSHSYVVIPKFAGTFESTAAKVVYRPGSQKEKGHTQLSYSNRVGLFEVESALSFEKRTAPHYKEWSIFSILSGLTVAPAFVMWWNASSKFNAKVTKRPKSN